MEAELDKYCASHPEFSREELYDTLTMVGENGAQFNCASTVLWVVSGKEIPIINPDDAHFFLSNAGYKIQARVLPFMTNERGVNWNLGLTSWRQDLLPGDVLVFSAKPSKEEAPSKDISPYDKRSFTLVTHVSLYLGQGLMFEKPDKHCGPESPFRIADLEAYIDNHMGRPSSGGNGNFEVVTIYRR